MAKQMITVVFEGRSVRASFRNDKSQEENEQILINFLETQRKIGKLFGQLWDF